MIPLGLLGHELRELDLVVMKISSLNFEAEVDVAVLKILTLILGIFLAGAWVVSRNEELPHMRILDIHESQSQRKYRWML
jgi:hypothetical protein